MTKFKMPEFDNDFESSLDSIDKELHGGSTVLPDDCQACITLLSITQYQSALILVAANIHDLAPKSARDILNVVRQQRYDTGVLIDQAISAIEAEIKE